MYNAQSIYIGLVLGAFLFFGFWALHQIDRVKDAADRYYTSATYEKMIMQKNCLRCHASDDCTDSAGRVL